MAEIKEVFNDVKKSIGGNGILIAGAVFALLFILSYMKQSKASEATTNYQAATSYASYPDAVTNANVIIDSLQNSINYSQKEVQDTVKEGTTSVNENMNNNFESTNESINMNFGKTNELISSGFDATKNYIHDEINTSTNSINSNINSGFSTVNSNINSGFSAVNNNIGELGFNISDKLDSTNNYIQQGLMNQANLSNKIDTVANISAMSYYEQMLDMQRQGYLTGGIAGRAQAMATLRNAGFNTYGEQSTYNGQLINYPGSLYGGYTTFTGSNIYNDNPTNYEMNVTKSQDAADSNANSNGTVYHMPESEKDKIVAYT